MKTYDRAQVLQVAAQLLAARAYDHGGQLDHDPAECSVRAALRLIDEVERQCPPPGKPETADPYNHLLRVSCWPRMPAHARPLALFGPHHNLQLRRNACSYVLSGKNIA